MTTRTRIRSLLDNRWVCLTAGLWLESCAGIGYMFGLYSQTMKSRLGYSQAMVDGLGMAKDLGGNLGIMSGFVGDYASNQVVICVGMIQNCFGYFCIWLALIGYLPSWLCSYGFMCFFMFVATNGSTYFNTAALVTNVKNFPLSRGPVVGLLKGYIGLSGAILNQIYLALYAPNSDSFLLMVSWLPAVVSLSVLPIIKPLIVIYEKEEQHNMLIVLALGVGLALYLMVASFVSHSLMLSSSVNAILAAGSLILLALPLWIPLSRKEAGNADVVVHADMADRSQRVGSKGSAASRAGEDSEAFLGGNSEVEKPSFPARGEDHSLLQAVQTVDFWLIAVAMVLASGSGLTAINNLGQAGNSLGYDQSSVGVLVSLMSVWNFLGRVSGGFVSEHFVREEGWSRPYFMVITQLIMSVGHALFASAFPGSLYVASVLVGLCYGAQWGIMPAVASEIFGLRYFSTMYNWLTITNPTGSYLLSVCVAGYLYDREAKKQHDSSSSPSPSPSGAEGGDGALLCVGVDCFRTAFIVMAGACLLASGASLCLANLNRNYYHRQYLKRRELEERANEIAGEST